MANTITSVCNQIVAINTEKIELRFVEKKFFRNQIITYFPISHIQGKHSLKLINFGRDIIQSVGTILCREKIVNITFVAISNF